MGGIVFYSMEDLLSQIKADEKNEYTVKVSYMEIYNERLRDLLVSKDARGVLMILEDPLKGIFIPDLTEYTISTNEEFVDLIKRGN